MIRRIHVPASTVLLVLRRLSGLAELPPVISDAFLKRLVAQSGSVRRGVRDTFKSLGLINRDDVPTARLHRLVAAFGKPEWANAVREFLETIFPNAISKQSHTIDMTKVLSKIGVEKGGDQQRNAISLARFIKVFAAEAGVGLGPPWAHAPSELLAPHTLSNGEAPREEYPFGILRRMQTPDDFFENEQDYWFIILPVISVDNGSLAEKEAFDTISRMSYSMFITSKRKT